VRSNSRSRKLLALATVTVMVVIAACAIPTDAGNSSSFRATLSGALNMSVAGTAAATAVDSAGKVYTFAGPAGVATMVISLQSADRRDIVSFSLSGTTLAPNTYSIRALNTVGPVPAAHAGFVHYQNDGTIQLYEGGAGTLTIKPDSNGVTRGEFAFQASGYDRYPAPATAPKNTVLSPLGHSDAALAVAGSFSAVRAGR
jgi:hypothetical protein